MLDFACASYLRTFPYPSILLTRTISLSHPKLTICFLTFLWENFNKCVRSHYTTANGASFSLFFVFFLQLIHVVFHPSLFFSISLSSILHFWTCDSYTNYAKKEPLIANAAEIAALLEIPVVTFKQLQYSACCAVLCVTIATLLSILR